MNAQSTTELEALEFATIELTASDLAMDELVATGPAPAEQADTNLADTNLADTNSLEAVELELALHNQNLVSLGFEESIHTALKAIGGEMLFQMRLENEDCQRVAAVRIGSEERQFALVIMPPDGGLMRVEAGGAKQQSDRQDHRILCRADGRLPRRGLRAASSEVQEVAKPKKSCLSDQRPCCA